MTSKAKLMMHSLLIHTLICISTQAMCAEYASGEGSDAQDPSAHMALFHCSMLGTEAGAKQINVPELAVSSTKVA